MVDWFEYFVFGSIAVCMWMLAILMFLICIGVIGVD